MREYLFRGFYYDVDGPDAIIVNGKKIKGRWIYGSYVKIRSKNGHMLDCIYVGIDTNAAPICYQRYNVDPDTVGLWTGLDDKYGVKIFEGDILSSSESPFTDTDGDSNYCAIVTLHEKDPALCLEVKKFPGAKVRGISDGISEKIEDLDSENYWVIGNIFSNPDLDF